MKTMPIASLLLAAVVSYPLRLPESTMGVHYSTSMGQQLSGCTIDTTAKTNPAMAKGLPPGLALSGNGSISGTPTTPAFWMFVAVCGDTRITATIKVKVK